MGNSGDGLPWQWNPTLRDYYIYIPSCDEIVTQDGRRLPRPPGIHPASMAAASCEPAAPRFTPVPSPYPPKQSEKFQTTPKAVPNYPHTSTSGKGKQVARPKESDSRSGPGGLSKASLEPSQPRVFEREGARFVQTKNPANGVSTTYQTAGEFTDPELRRQGRQAAKNLIGSPGESERLFPEYRKKTKPRQFFTVGRIFMVLWAEPMGENNTVVTSYDKAISRNSYGELVYSKTRRFIVIREGETFCSALPILTYTGQGVAKQGVTKSDHVVVYTGKRPPQLLPGEAPTRVGERGMRARSIQVDPDTPSDALDPASRLNLAQIHTVQHNIKVKSCGKVNQNSQDALLAQFNNVFNGPPSVPDLTNRFANMNTGASSASGSVPPPSADEAHERVRQLYQRRAPAQIPEAVEDDPEEEEQGDNEEEADEDEDGEEEAEDSGDERYR